MSLSKKIEEFKVDYRIEPKLELEKQKLKWMLNSKITYKLPEYKGFSNKVKLIQFRFL